MTEENIESKEYYTGFKKYPDIERLGHEDNQDILLYGDDTIVIEEKVDGGNGSFWVEIDGIIHFGSRNRDLTAENDDKAFEGFQKQLKDHLINLDKKNIKPNPDYMYYIEWMQRHTISYTNVPYVIGLDIRLKHSANSEGPGFFIGRDSKEQEFKRLELECVPCIWRGTSNELKKLNIRELIPKSKYFDGIAEGIVIKNYCRKSHSGNHQLYAKIVREEFKEDNKAVFGGLRSTVTDTSKIIDEFCTEARIRKAVLKFVNEDSMPLNLTLMKYVPSYVMKDILKEEITTIFDKYKFLDFKEMRSKIPKKCLGIINDMMEKRGTENDILRN
jgi:hypothetical protein